MVFRLIIDVLDNPIPTWRRFVICALVGWARITNPRQRVTDCQSALAAESILTA